MGRLHTSVIVGVMLVALSALYPRAIAGLAASGSAQPAHQEPGDSDQVAPPLTSVAEPSPGVPLPAEHARAVASILATGTLPIIDLHFHPDRSWNIDALVLAFDQVGVALAGNGPTGPDDVALDFARQYPDRFLPFGGQGVLGNMIRTEGGRALNLESPGVLGYLARLESNLQIGRFKGIGELFANNQHSHPAGAPDSLYPADAPLIQRLWVLSATYGVPLSVHMEPTPESVAGMERLLASNRDGTWIWAHTGHYGEPDLLRPLLERHPNLYCELSWREGLHLAPRGLQVPIADNGILRPAWRDLLEARPDRFVIGTDIDEASPAGRTTESYRLTIGLWRQILGQLSPEAARQIAYANAERLLRLAPAG